MIATFPSFTMLSADIVADIDTLTEDLPEYSDYNSASLLAWDIEQDTEIAQLNGNLVVMFRDYMDGSRFITLYGTNDIQQSISLVLQYAKKTQLQPELKLVPEETVKCVLQNKRYCIEADRDNFDYIVDIAKIAELRGKKFRRIRQQINNFEERFKSDATICKLSLDNESHIREMLDVFEKREIQKPYNDERAEHAALSRLISYHKYFDIEVRGIRLKGILHAFIIIQKTNRQLVGHFCKADVKLKGIYYFLLQACCQEFMNHGYRHINLEQDLGIEGLRESKQQLRAELLRKYSIQPLTAQQTESEPACQQLSLQLSYAV